MSDGQVDYLPFDDPRLGRHIRHDPQSRNFPAPRAAVERRDIRWRNHSRHKLFQGNVGACTGFTAAQALNTEPYRSRRRGQRQPLTSNADGFAFYSGATGRDPWAGVWPPTDTGSSGVAVAQELRARGEISAFEWAFGYAHGVQALAAGPLLQGTWWEGRMFQPDRDGRLHLGGGDVGGHEYLWIGLEVVSKRNPSQDRSWFLNSWEDEPSGDYWGVDARGRQGPGGGYFYLTRDDHEALLARDGDLIRLVL